MLIPKKVEKALNEHLALELGAIYHYLAVASWCDKESYEGAASFFYKQSAEEHAHFMKFFNYINEMGGHALVPELKKPQVNFKSVVETCELSLLGEQKVTKGIYSIVDLARNEKDHATVEFLKFFVDEQRKGPYNIWHHEHHFKAVEGGVLMTDLLHYDICLLYTSDAADE